MIVTSSSSSSSSIGSVHCCFLFFWNLNEKGNQETFRILVFFFGTFDASVDAVVVLFFAFFLKSSSSTTFQSLSDGSMSSILSRSFKSRSSRSSVVKSSS